MTTGFRRVDPSIRATGCANPVAPPLLTHRLMLVEAVYEYRTLQGKCDLGLGLEWDEIDRFSAIETLFAPANGERNGRRYRREAVELDGTLRGDRIQDRVAIIELSPGGVVVRNAPYIARGELVEVMIDVGDSSYRFVAEGVWLRDDGDDYRVGLMFRGMPVAIRTIDVARHQPEQVDIVIKRAA